MAVKIVRQVKNIALLGAPTSAAGLGAGQEGAPAALRSAGLAERLTAAGFHVTDHGDCAPRVYKPDDEHPRARNASEALAIIEELRPKVEAAVKSGALARDSGGRRHDGSGRNRGFPPILSPRQRNLRGSRCGAERAGHDAFRMPGWHGDLPHRGARRAGTGALLGRTAADPRARRGRIWNRPRGPTRAEMAGGNAAAALSGRGHQEARRGRGCPGSAR